MALSASLHFVIVQSLQHFREIHRNQNPHFSLAQSFLTIKSYFRKKRTTPDLACMEYSPCSSGSSSFVPSTGTLDTIHTVCRNPSCNVSLIDNLKWQEADKFWWYNTHCVSPHNQVWMNAWQTHKFISLLKKGSVTAILICIIFCTKPQHFQT